MPTNYGKQFEAQFKADIEKLSNTLLLRLPDQQSGYFGTSQNICDFILFRNRTLYFLELKSIKGNTFPLSNYKQLEKMYSLPSVDGVEKYLIVWYRDHDKIIAMLADDVHNYKQSGAKSININKLEGLTYINIPCKKKRVMLTSDYSVLFK